MNELAEQLKVALADTFAFYLKSHNFHWNVTGSNFPQLHSFFEMLYSDAWGAVDLIAEHIRTLDEFVPGSFIRYKTLATIEDETAIPQGMSMVSKLEADNKKVIDSLTKAMVLADSAKKVGISNFLQDRIDIHEKWGWQLRSIMK